MIMQRFLYFFSKLSKNIWNYALMVGLILINIILKPICIVDDALISFRYAYNLANHGELVFNLGERVEGITNFLWTLILSGFAWLGLDIGYSAIILALFLVFWMGFRTWKLGTLIASNSFIGLQAWSLVILSSGYWSTMTNGLEAPLFAALIFEVIYQYAKENYYGAFFFAGLTFFTRPEGLGLIVLLFIVIVFVENSFLRGMKGLGIALGMVISLEIFRYSYYGSLIPNSVIAKSFPLEKYFNKWTINSIYFYFSGFVKPNLHLVIATVGAFLLFIQSYIKKNKRNGMLSFCLGGGIIAGLSIVKNGGDWMSGYRLFFQYAPILIVFLIFIIKEKLIHTYVWIAMIIGLVISYYPAVPITNINKFTNFKKPAEEVFYHWQFLVESTQRLKPILHKEDKVAAEGLGYVGYTLKDHYVHDLLGLTDTYLAKNGKPIILYGKGDPIYSLAEVQPAVVIVHKKSFIQNADQDLLDLYHTYCYQDCNSPGSDIVMIRLDRVEALGSGFQDWKTISLKSSLP